MYHFYIFFQFAPACFPRAVFDVFTSAAVAHGTIVLLKIIDILFYEYHVQANIS